MQVTPPVRYDEPPLAPFRRRPAAEPVLIRASYQEPAPPPRFEVAPMPRPPVPADGPRLMGPSDRY
jgi:hypothetical protein